MNRKIHKLLCAMTVLTLLLIFAMPAFAAPPLLVDEANLLSASEASELKEKLGVLSDKWQNDIVIVTVKSIGNKTPMAFADDYFDYNGYGRGGNNDGLLLLLNMSERDWWISTCGHSIYAFTDAGIAFLGEEMISNGLSDGDYAGAFNSFADWCGKFFEKAESGKPFDKGSMPKTSANVIALFIMAFLGGCIVAWIYTRSLKKQLKTVQKKQQAADYLRPGSLNVTYANEQFLFSNVTRVATPTSDNSSSSGGSSTHTSSSGSTHGGGGGRF